MLRSLAPLLLAACSGGTDKGGGDWLPEAGIYDGIYSHLDPNECAQTQGFPVLEVGLRIHVDDPNMTVEFTNHGQVDGPAIHCALDGISFDCVSAGETEEVEGFDATTTADIGVVGTFTSATRLSGHVYVIYGCSGADCEDIGAEVCTTLIHYEGIPSEG